MQIIGNLDFIGLPVVVRALTGTVEAESTQTNQQITSSRNLAGNVASVSSVTNSEQIIWLKRDDGQETPVKILRKIDVRPGHRLQVFYMASSQSNELGTIVAIKNVNTDQTYDLFGAGRTKIGTVGFFKIPLLSSLGAGGMIVLIGFLVLLLFFVYLSLGIPSPVIPASLTVAIPVVWQHIAASNGLKASKAELDRLINLAPSL